MGEEEPCVTVTIQDRCFAKPTGRKSIFRPDKEHEAFVFNELSSAYIWQNDHRLAKQMLLNTQKGIGVRISTSYKE